MRIKNMIKKATVAALTAVMILAPIVNIKAALSGRKILSLIRRQRQKTMRSILQEQEMMELRPEIFILENIM